MKMNFYCVKDLMTERFLNPALSGSDEEAIRQFRSNLMHINLWKDNPSDFDLMCVGSFDDESGAVESCFRKVINGRSAINAVKKED